VLRPLVRGPLQISEEGHRLRTAVEGTAGLLPRAVRVLDEAGAAIEDAALLQPSLDDVFLRLTGAGAADQPAAAAAVAEEVSR
jgi:ABC-2 type transport system ATP-binding protein